MNICIADKLYESVAARGPICVGLDTDISYVPQWLAAQYQTPGEAVFAFNRQIIDATADVAGCFKAVSYTHLHLFLGKGAVQADEHVALDDLVL